MTDFDKLLKEKAEQAHYPYRHSAWKNFAAKAGISMSMSAGQIAAAVASVLIVAGGITLAVVSRPHSHSTPPDAPTEFSKTTVAVDTVTATTLCEEQTSETAPVESNTPDPPAYVTPRPETPQTTPASSDPAKTTTNMSATTEKRHRVDTIRGRAVTINVDTITDNEVSEEQLRKGHSRLY